MSPVAGSKILAVAPWFEAFFFLKHCSVSNLNLKLLQREANCVGLDVDLHRVGPVLDPHR
jgi:hypothetical protein